MEGGIQSEYVAGGGISSNIGYSPTRDIFLAGASENLPDINLELLRASDYSLVYPGQVDQDNQLLQLCMARTAWSESDQAVRTVRSCTSW